MTHHAIRTTWTAPHTTTPAAIPATAWERLSARAQAAGEAHLEAIDLAEARADDADLAGEDSTALDHPAPLWCGGCETCTVREVLAAALPVTLTELATELRALGETHAAGLILAGLPTGP